MKYEKGIVYYDKNGKIICPICERSFSKLISHVIQKHNMSGKEFRLKHGFCVGFSFMSKEAKEKAREANLKNYDKVVINNLINGGKETRFKGIRGNKPVHVITEQRRNIIAKARNKVNKEKQAQRMILVVQPLGVIARKKAKQLSEVIK